MNTKKMTVLFASVLLVAAGVQAHLIELGEFDPADAGYKVPLGSPSTEASWIESIMTLAPGTLAYLNKFDYDNMGWEDDGAVSGSFFDVNFTVDEEDESTSGQVSWNLSGSDWELSYMLLKSANNYFLYGVSPDQVVSSDGWDDFNNGPVKKGISHISFFGRTGTPTTNVPDGGMTVLLLGAGLAGLASATRWHRR